MSHIRFRYLLPVLFLVAFCVRTPTLGLPLEGDGALLAGKAVEGSFLAPGSAPLLPALIAASGTVGISPTAALRLLDALFTAALAPLLVLLAAALGLSKERSSMAGMLMALHPLALAGAGGIAPGSGALASALLLAALAGLGSRRAPQVRLGGCCTLLLAVADPAGLLLVLPLLWLYARRETSPRLQTGLLMIGAALIVTAPLTWFTWSGGSRPALGSLLAWVAGATLGILLPALPRGFSALIRGGAVAHAWLTGSLLVTVALLAAGPMPAVVLLPLVLVAGIEGMAGWAEPWRRRLAPAAVGGALLVSMWLVSGGLQAALLPDEPAEAGRLHLLREAMQTAAEAAGENGWIVLAVGAGRPEEQASLADLHPDRWTWTERAAEGDAIARRRLMVFPAASFESGRSVAVLAEAGREAGVHTFDGAGIYHQEVVREVGPYVVLRARRP